MKHLFIPYELAKLAEEKGFDEECFGVYTDTTNKTLFIIGHEEGYLQARILCNAPLRQQLVDWFREKHNIEIQVRIMAGSDILGNRIKGKEKVYYYWIFDLNQKYWNSGETISKEYFNYYEALDSAIKEAFKLIP